MASFVIRYNQPMTSIHKIFISYAWESEQFKSDVLAFAKWLATQLDIRGHKKYQVEIDVLHSITPPAEGWHTWMHNEIQKAETVFLICTPKYLSGFNKDTEGDAGRGSTYEGSIINLLLYNNFQQNRKFFPILPDNGEIRNIPLVLQPWWNNLHFNTNNEEIFRLILRQNPSLLSTTDPAAETAVVEEIVETVKQENAIIEEIASSIEDNSTPMLNPVQTLVRAFVTLSSLEKIEVAKNIGVYDSNLQQLSPNDFDKEIFKQIKQRNLVHLLWNELRQRQKIEPGKNPFKP